MEKKEEINIDLDNDIQEKVSQKNLPDKNTEFFWYGFKNAIINLVTSLKQELKKKDNEKDIDKEDKLNYILKDLEERSNLYNEMQKQNKFEEINIEIEIYMKLISRNFFIQYADDYHFNIFCLA